ncbi:sirohydrochlorin cobaltochelatase [Sporanaerobium hydrogeniformans]|uniref:sirohydrochlorin cobaltochelatase n=1 Tax=Sporanaerobium hydrogeniformans TaxID=3072179 RepID=UPI0026C6C26E|nr:sirohydrochlorin cobaltochelatase [Sporanaerobium hydrogeniformans]
MKKALLVISFGTTYKETREKTIEACEKDLSVAFPGYDFFRAYTSYMIIEKLKRRDNLIIDTPFEALERIKALGYEEVVIQSLHIICGDEYDKMKASIEPFKESFKSLSIGRPLLTTIEDYEKTVQSVAKELPSLKEDEAIVFMGHGTTHPCFSAYCALEHAFRKQGIPVYMGTVEGYPTFEHVLEDLKAKSIRFVYLLPFMLVAGDHAENDMAGEEEDSWVNQLLKANIQVEVLLKGLGENAFIRELFVEHAKESLKA